QNGRNDSTSVEIIGRKGAPGRRPPRARVTAQPAHRAAHPDRERPAGRPARAGNRPAVAVAAIDGDHARASRPTALP
ncbi:hypothetical protein O4J56_28975, partial [Nocardiopsis sp. RSe5-2]